MKCPYCGEPIELPRLSMDLFRVVLEALERNRWNRSATCRELGMDIRKLNKWLANLRRMGVHIPPGRDRWHEEKAEDRAREREWVKHWVR